MLNTTVLAQLKTLRNKLSRQPEASLSDEQIATINDTDLSRAIALAEENLQGFTDEQLKLIKLSQAELRKKLQANILNFYSHNSGSPYVPLASSGPWIVTVHGGVIYDTGGYGMMGFGHNPKFIERTLSHNRTIANVMTASFEQSTLIKQLNAEISHQGKSFFDAYTFMNSGSEAVAVAARIADARTLQLIEAGVISSDTKVKYLGLKQGFHGRTYRAATASNSSLKGYMQLASFRNADFVDLVCPNCIKGLKKKFADAKKNNVHYEMMFIEPVMGEGKAGNAITPEFYAVARELTTGNNTLLLSDSIQAGMRCSGELSIMNYKGFETLDAPDFETYSKAVNGGQYPFSLLAMSGLAATSYRKGIYGNTMTGNPRALAIASECLKQQTSEVKNNIVDNGLYFKEQLKSLSTRFPNIAGEVLGTGLLLSIQLDEKYAVEGIGSVEESIRLRGINVIHGSGNRLRFTPWFLINKNEVDLIIEIMTEIFESL